MTTHFTETKLTHSPLVIHRFDPVPLHFLNIVLQEGVVVFKCQGSPWKTDRRNFTMTTLPLCPKVWCTRHLCFTEENNDKPINSGFLGWQCRSDGSMDSTAKAWPHSFYRQAAPKGFEVPPAWLSWNQIPPDQWFAASKCHSEWLKDVKSI